MKKSNKIIAVTVLILVLILTIVPSILKSKVSKLIVEEIESNTGYQVKYDDFKMTFFRSFPRIKINVTSFLLQSPSETVLDLAQLQAELSLGKVMKNELELISAQLTAPKLKYTHKTDDLFPQEGIQDEDANSSQEITRKSTPAASKPLFPIFRIQSLSAVDGEIMYQSTDSLNLTLSDINLQLEGHLNVEEVLLKTQLSIASVNYSTNGFSLKGIPLNFEAEMAYLIAEQNLQLNDNFLELGGLVTSFIGGIYTTDIPDFDLSFEAPNADVKSLLALLPPAFVKDLSTITAAGEVQLKGFIKGKHEGIESLPAFGADVSVKDAWFKYADLPAKVEGINFSAILNHPKGTNADSTTIAIDKLTMKSGDNVLKSQLHIINPATDVVIRGSVKSQLDFATLRNALPMQAIDIVGKINANITFDGKLSDIEQENYEAFDAAGQLTLNDYYLKNKAIPQGLRVSTASMRFTPERINISSFRGKLGTSDLRLSGYLSNYFAYLFDDKALNGVLELNSNYININEFLAYDAEVASAVASSTNSSSTSPMPEKGLLLVPNDLNIIFKSTVSQAKVDDLMLKDFRGTITVKDSKILLNALNFATLDGTITINGQYNSQTPKAVFSDLALKLTNIDVAKATKSVSVLRQMMPISQTTQGKISSEMQYYALFDNTGEVDIKSIKSTGYISSPGLRIANNASLDKLATQLNDPRYSDITTSAVTIDYTMANGVLTLAPFDVKMVDKNINAGGWYSVENELNFRIKTTVKAKEIGGDVSKYIGMVSDVNKPLPVTIILTGDAKNPDVKYDTREAIKVLRDDVTKNLNKDAINSILKGFF